MKATKDKTTGVFLYSVTETPKRGPCCTQDGWDVFPGSWNSAQVEKDLERLWTEMRSEDDLNTEEDEKEEDEDEDEEEEK